MLSRTVRLVQDEYEQTARSDAARNPGLRHGRAQDLCGGVLRATSWEHVAERVILGGKCGRAGGLNMAQSLRDLPVPHGDGSTASGMHDCGEAGNKNDGRCRGAAAGWESLIRATKRFERNDPRRLRAMGWWARAVGVWRRGRTRGKTGSGAARLEAGAGL